LARTIDFSEEAVQAPVGAADHDVRSFEHQNRKHESHAGQVSNVSKAAAADVPTVNLRGGITTELGGLLYLINVMERLHIPGSFGSEWQLVSQVSQWEILEMIARALLAATTTRYVDDPIWIAFAELTGRESAKLSVDRRQVPLDFRIPKRWREILPDVRDRADGPMSGPLIDHLSPPLVTWLNLVLPYITAWLRQTLHVSKEDSKMRFLCELFCLRSRLYVTTTHVDLVMKIDQIHLPARRAGLDQDPGWLPHWGRVVQFHFDE
jgi:hypothetical protein